MQSLSLRILSFLVLVTSICYGQKSKESEFAAIDKKALQLPDSLTANTKLIADYITTNFSSDLHKSRAIFIWVASNIQYDVDNMFAINFYEKKEDKISKVLLTRKGICENYAALFTDICLKAGMKSYVVEGYTKQNGFTDYIPHAWSATMIDSTWYLFDPTWGSGYVSGGRFYKKINNNYFKVGPSTLIKSHMPFDCMWQFLNYPVTSQEFYEGKVLENKSKPVFNFKDSIQVYERQSQMDQLASTARRVEKNGVKNSLTFDRLQHLRLQIEHERQNRVVNLYNSAVVDYNEGINAFNQFINYRNRQFNPPKSDAEIKQMLDVAEEKLQAARIKTEQISTTDSNTLQLVLQLTKSIDEASLQVDEQQRWLSLYFSKGKSARKSMFYDKKVTWFGIPLN